MLPKGVIVDGGPHPSGPDTHDQAILSNFENWVLTGKWEQVASSVIESAAYDLAASRLKVRFKNGGGGKWAEIPVDKVQGFYNAPSKMGWWWDNVAVRGPGGKGKHQVPVGDL